MDRDVWQTHSPENSLTDLSISHDFSSILSNGTSSLAARCVVASVLCRSIGSFCEECPKTRMRKSDWVQRLPCQDIVLGVLFAMIDEIHIKLVK